MPACNGLDRGYITPPEKGQTSLGCWRTWTVSQPAQGATQISRQGRNDPRWCGLRHRSHIGSRLCLSNVQVGPKTNGAAASSEQKVRCPMLEPDARKPARPVLRGRGGSNASLLPDQRTAGASRLSGVNGSPAPAAAELARSVATRCRRCNCSRMLRWRLWNPLFC